MMRLGIGALGVVEAGFVNPHSPFTIEVHGTTLMDAANQSAREGRTVQLGGKADG